ncbi:MAG: hypothetical protein ACREP1_07600 [Rhodanobacteraceae bacterium]
MNGKITWTSEGLHLNADTCLDLKAGPGGVLLSVVSEFMRYEVHLTAGPARWLAMNLHQGADEAENGSAP